ncbi:hypothetical protein [Microbacterium dauci]|uniref:Uncharacterized protein n=1 Tax=Microbacterium dauci TaxID=3048008 RepID=A0ABT6ZAS2_9MICO|nr:hypothetical protein [Microbacterium sp. LX3-4]MDJ1113253.1 hypothetical protein [Microbacterium sp. LX3-4]
MADLLYGYVTWSFVRAIGGDGEAEVPASGTVLIVPVRPVRPVSNPSRTVADAGEELRLVNGELVREGDPAGPVRVVAGHYRVTPKIDGIKFIHKHAFTAVVTAEHDADHPLDLSTVVPLTPAPDVEFVVNERVYQDTLKAKADAVGAAGTATAAAGTATDAATEATDALTEIRTRTLTATIDPDDPDALILTFPAFMLNADGTSIDLPIGGIA